MPEKQYSPVNTNYPQPDASVFDDWRMRRDRSAGAAILAAYEDFFDATVSRYVRSLENCGGTIDRADLHQSGREDTLFRQVRFYDPSKRVRFLAYATRGIKGAIYNEYLRNHGAVSLPNEFGTKFLAYDAERFRRESAMEPPLTDAEIAELTELPETGTEWLTSERKPLTVPSFKVTVAALGAESLEQLRHTDPEVLESMVPLTTATAYPNLEELPFKLSVWHLLDVAFTPPPTKNQTPTKEETEAAVDLENQKKAVILTHGLDDGFARSRGEVAYILGISSQDASLLYTRAIRRLRKIAKEQPELQLLNKD